MRQLLPYPVTLQRGLPPCPLKLIPIFSLRLCLWAGRLFRYVTSHPGQLSLAIPPWVGTMHWGAIGGPGGNGPPIIWAKPQTPTIGLQTHDFDPNILSVATLWLMRTSLGCEGTVTVGLASYTGHAPQTVVVHPRTGSTAYMSRR